MYEHLQQIHLQRPSLYGAPKLKPIAAGHSPQNLRHLQLNNLQRNRLLVAGYHLQRPHAAQTPLAAKKIYEIIKRH